MRVGIPWLVLLVACGPEASASAPVASESAPPPSEPILEAIERGSGDGPVVVMLHGYGGRPEEMLSFADRTDLPAGTRLFFPRAPDPTHPPDGPEGGAMWWQFTGEFHDIRALSYPGMPIARARLGRYLDALTERLHVPSERIVLGGFSQGAILSLDFALHDARPLAGLVLLSPTFVDREVWTPLMPSRRGLRVYQAHGTRDDVLYYPPARELSEAMRAAGIDVRFTSFDGGHEVTQLVSEEAAAFVREVTAR